jgi:hypothetical protein
MDDGGNTNIDEASDGRKVAMKIFLQPLSILSSDSMMIVEQREKAHGVILLGSGRMSFRAAVKKFFL